MRFRFFVLGLVVLLMIVLAFVVYKRGYLVTGNIYLKGLTIDSREQLSQLKNFLVDDKKRIVWWEFKFLNKIDVEKNKLVYGSTVPGGNVVVGCSQNRIVLGGFVKRVEVLINPNLWTVEEQKKHNILFVQCSVLSYDKDYQINVIDNFVNLFNQDQFILKKR